MYDENMFQHLVTAFAPPQFLLPPSVGVDISTSGIKTATLSETSHGLILSSYKEKRFPSGTVDSGDIADQATVITTLSELADSENIKSAYVSLPETKSYLFETAVSGHTKAELRTSLEQHIDEFVPLPPAETMFDLVPTGNPKNGKTPIAGVGYAVRVVDSALSVFDEAGIEVSALEGEMFATARSLLPNGDTSTTMLVDIGRNTTKLAIVTARIPLFATTINTGGHAFTLAVQKHFGVTEEEARIIKSEHGIISVAGNEDYIATMLSTAAVIKDEVARRFEYWHSKAGPAEGHAPITRVILSGGNASLRGLTEYLEETLRVPVVTGDVFTNLAPRSVWIPTLAYEQSLAYATTIGLALRPYVPNK